MRNNIQVVRSV